MQREETEQASSHQEASHYTKNQISCFPISLQFLEHRRWRKDHLLKLPPTAGREMEKRFNDRVIPAVPFSAHRTSPLMLGKKRLILLPGVLTALVVVIHPACRRLSHHQSLR
jgi:hypothetical protein